MPPQAEGRLAVQTSDPYASPREPLGTIILTSLGRPGAETRALAPLQRSSANSLHGAGSGLKSSGYAVGFVNICEDPSSRDCADPCVPSPSSRAPAIPWEPSTSPP